MYRLLEVGEVIENGDEYFDSYEWKSFKHLVGLPIKGSTLPTRRLVKPAVTPTVPSVPDPGEGWRLLKEGETIEKEDEFLNISSVKGEWFSCFMHVGAAHSSKQYAIRRRVAQPDPVVSVGDRVKVLSGPWAGCTGVVLSFDYPQGRTVKLDHVHVGGSQLSVVSQVEKLPPVVPEVLFRDLSHGETVKAGDQFWKFGYGPWTDAGPKEIGDTITTYKARHRRPVRVQSPGWRYLDAGETVQAGDETEYSVPPFWRCASGCSSYLGRVFEGHDKFFRRKLPANVGG